MYLHANNCHQGTWTPVYVDSFWSFNFDLNQYHPSPPELSQPTRKATLRLCERGASHMN
jgi:hypothetical protein